MNRKSGLVIVDTSVFIDFFRGRKCQTFEELVRQNRVLLSDYVRIELLMGVKSSERGKLNYVLSGLIDLIHQPRVFSEAQRIIIETKLKGLTIGTVDLLIAAQSKIGKFRIYSKDKVFSRLAASKIIEVY